MTVEEHYAKLLQLPPPWEVTKVEESLIEHRVTVLALAGWGQIALPGVR